MPKEIISRRSRLRFVNASFYFEDAGGKVKMAMMRNIKLLSLLTAILFLNFACERKIDEIYLIPRGFSGNVAVVFDVKEGEQEMLENGWRVYRIPEDGILITQASDNSTLHDEKYFFVEDGGERIAIPRSIWGGDEEVQRLGLSDDEVFVRFNGAAGSANRANYSWHYVGSRQGMDASEKDFSFSGSTNLDARVDLKLNKLLGEKISETR